jgi:hypothetical protein
MKLPPGEGIVLSDSTGTPVIILDPSMDGLPTISLSGGTFGGQICLQIDHGRPRIIFRRPNGKDGLYLTCRGDGEMLVFHDHEGRRVLWVGYDAETDKPIGPKSTKRSTKGHPKNTKEKK